MIAFVRGTVAAVGLDSVVVDVAGVGLQLHCTPGTLARLRPGAEATVSSALVVREDSLTLFGFADDDERTLFELLQTASGVGPKLAQAMLAVHPPDELRRAVRDEDVRALTAVPGIGQKGAQRIILELKDRLGPPTGPSRTRSPAQPAWRDQVRSGLVGLGWSPRDADQAVDRVAPEDGDVPDVAALLRAALQTLSRG
jgi:Holliday junction DNA helicase RuvA